MSIQSEIDRINNNVQSTLSTIAETGVEVGTNSDALPAAAAALANEKANVSHTHTMADIIDLGGSTLTSITFTASAWVQGSAAYEQTVSVSGGTANSHVALQPTVSQLLTLKEKGVSAFMVNNDNGTFKAYSVGAAPTTDLTIQAILTEVSV